MDAEHTHQDVAQVVEYVLRRGFKRVTLQFPDDQLMDAPLVAAALSRELAAVSDAQVYILADTTYNPLAVDEVAAEHVIADCVIHYGHASLSPVSRKPALCILPKQPMDVAQCSSAVADLLAEASSSSDSTAGLEAAVLLHDQAYHNAWPALQEALSLAYQGPLQLIPAQLRSLELDPCPPPSSSSGSGTAGSKAGDSSPSVVSAGAACGNCLCKHADASADASALGSASVESPISTAQPNGADSGVPTARVEGTVADSSTNNSTAAGATTSGSSAPALEAIGGLTWQQPPGIPPERCVMLWIGPASSPVLMALQMTHSGRSWLAYDPATGEVTKGVLLETARLLKRRYYLVEKARSASIIGILVGTLGAAGYQAAMSRIRTLARAAGKHTYTLLVGKPSPAKLANFPEVEVFVMVADPLGLILDSREYLAPVITPHEALLAFGGEDTQLDPAVYRLDFGELLCAQTDSQTASSALGGDGGGRTESSAVALPTSLALSQQTQQRQVAPKTAAEYLQLRRSYKGLETPATGADIKAPMLAVQGLSGRAAGYASEPTVAAVTGAQPETTTSVPSSGALDGDGDGSW